MTEVLLGRPLEVALAMTGFGFLIAVASTRPLIAWLAARQFGKAIRVDGPDHQAKSGTPTMGGLGMLLALLVGLTSIGLPIASRAPASDAAMPRSPILLSLVLVAVAGLGYALLGLVDDLQGLERKRGGGEIGVGLGARQMLALQTLLGLLLGLLATRLPPELTRLPALPAGLLALLIAFALVGTVNGVNLSDGLDGLAAGLIAIASGSLGLTLLRLPSSGIEPDLLVHLPLEREAWLLSAWLALTITGACLGFLVFNRHPARVFMGNVASMGLGGALAMLFLVSGRWWLLPIVGAVFVAEVVSDIIQIAYFRRTGGKRFFRMAPLHHHFERGGMHETQVVRRFWAAGLLAGLLGLVLGN
ncbi:MAG: phospho-N-acetylmuramoyl-pentapeptide-transferase [Caldilineae bacterium]|nr:phospho-N-acetylmuramoyl-pentapeptide-transferase [Chloroflexota bacterium]MCB9177712.1 phospho-N-acetylmuramoyl-pentapeptide-transferase [Caldilineae bacterium]